LNWPLLSRSQVFLGYFLVESQFELESDKKGFKQIFIGASHPHLRKSAQMCYLFSFSLSFTNNECTLGPRAASGKKLHKNKKVLEFNFMRLSRKKCQILKKIKKIFDLI
jgi:hypothetical protein